MDGAGIHAIEVTTAQVVVTTARRPAPDKQSEIGFPVVVACRMTRNSTLRFGCSDHRVRDPAIVPEHPGRFHNPNLACANSALLARTLVPSVSGSGHNGGAGASGAPGQPEARFFENLSLRDELPALSNIGAALGAAEYEG
jgi:hypothetical protein